MSFRLGDIALESLLSSDVPLGDLTTHLLGIGRAPGVMSFSARGRMVVAAVEDAARLLELTGCRVEVLSASGDALEARAPILAAHGPSASLHHGWKMAQLLIETASGIATATRAIVEAARAVDPAAAVAGTRKTVPGAKALSLSALLAGGAVPHRLGLSETILVFAEHRAFLGGEPPADTIARLRRGAPERTIVVEVASVEEGMTWAAAGADVIQAEKFPVEAVAELAARRHHCRHGRRLCGGRRAGDRHLGALYGQAARRGGAHRPGLNRCLKRKILEERKVI